MSDSGIFATLVLALWPLGKANNDNITIKERIFTTNHKSQKCRQKVLQIVGLNFYFVHHVIHTIVIHTSVNRIWSSNRCSGKGGK